MLKSHCNFELLNRIVTLHLAAVEFWLGYWVSDIGLDRKTWQTLHVCSVLGFFVGLRLWLRLRP